MKPSYNDAFFVRDFGLIDWMQYNDDCDCREQYVYNTIGYGDIENAAENCSTPEDFFENLEMNALQTVCDADTEEFEEAAKDFQRKANFVGLTEETMEALIKFVAQEEERIAKETAERIKNYKQELAVQKTEKAKVDKKYMYLVYEVNYNLPEMNTVEETDMELVNGMDEAIAYAEKRKDEYIEEGTFTYMPDESSTGKNYAFVYNLGDDGVSREGGFDIYIAKLPIQSSNEVKNGNGEV